MTGGVLRCRSVAHGDATLDAIEAAAEADQRDAVAALLAEPGVDEALVLQTCHRVEAYVVAPAPPPAERALDAQYGGAGRTLDHEESLRHLLSVAAGLESAVLGEDQVLGQVRTALEDAREAGGVGPVLEDAATKAIHVGERARTETDVNEGVLSMGRAAVRLARRDAQVTDRDALVVGAGEMGQLAATALDDAGVASLTVANRTPARAERLAETLDCPADPRGLDELGAAVADVAVAVFATGSEDPLVEPDDLASAGETTVVDLGQPRDVATAAAEVPGVTLYDVEDIESVTSATESARRAAATEVSAMVDRELDRLHTQFKRKRADEVVAGMYAGAERVKERELERALDRLETTGELPPAQREVVESLADALVSKLLAAPTESLREAAAEDDWETINTAIQLFDPDADGDPTDVSVPDPVPADDD